MINPGGLHQAYRYLIPFIAVLILILGLSIDIMDVDATQYALMSKDLVDTENWLHFYCRGIPYLDKPPLIFWITALSFKLFGFTNWAYKLPSLIVMLAGAWGLYRTSLLWYNKRTAEFTLVVFVFSFWFFMISQDVKTDNLLIGFSCLSLWGISEWLHKGTWKWMLLAAVFQALALLSKGPIATISLGSAIGVHLLLTKSWKKIFHWHWLLFIIVIVGILFPMTYGLFTQYGIKGVRFFYWTQSFGRITGESSWSNELGPDFFFHTTLWAFLPWAPIAFTAIFMAFKTRLASKLAPNRQEWLSLGGLILPFIALSTSKFKLPHYIFITFPYLALITAEYINRITELDKKKFLVWTFWSLLFLVISIILSLAILLIVFPSQNFLMISIVSGLFFIGIISLFHPKATNEVKWVGAPAIGMAIFGLTLNVHFYPELMQYQSGGTAGRWIDKNCRPDDSVHGYKLFGYSLDLYANRRIGQIEDLVPVLQDLRKGKSVFLLFKEVEISNIEKWGVTMEIKSTFPSFHVSLLTPEFLNPNTRLKSLETVYIAKVKLKH